MVQIRFILCAKLYVVYLVFWGVSFSYIFIFLKVRNLNRVLLPTASKAQEILHHQTSEDVATSSFTVPDMLKITIISGLQSCSSLQDLRFLLKSLPDQHSAFQLNL